MASVHKEKSCGAVVFRYDEDVPLFLLVHQNDGHWGFPKGHVEKGETQRETADREIQEETGLHCAFAEGFMMKTHYHPKPRVKKTAVYYLAVPYAGKEQVQKEELSEMKWTDETEAWNLLTFENDRKVLKEAAEFLKQRRI